MLWNWYSVRYRERQCNIRDFAIYRDLNICMFICKIRYHYHTLRIVSPEQWEVACRKLLSHSIDVCIKLRAFLRAWSYLIENTPKMWRRTLNQVLHSILYFFEDEENVFWRIREIWNCYHSVSSWSAFYYLK